MIKQFFRSRCKALSLIEVSIALLIVGLLIAGATKGWHWVESTKLNNTVHQILQIQVAQENSKLNNAAIAEQEAEESPEVFWKKLNMYGGPKPNNQHQVTSSIGAKFTYNNANVELAPVNAQQAKHIKDTLDPNASLGVGWIRVVNEENQTPKSLDITNKTKNLKVLIIIN